MSSLQHPLKFKVKLKAQKLQILKRRWLDLAIASACSIAAIYPAQSHAEDFAQLDTRLRYDSNLGNAKAPYIVSDSSWLTSLILGKQHFLGESNVNLSYAAKLSNESFNRLPGLSHTGAGIQISGKHKLGIGPYAPNFTLTAALERQAFRDQIRNATQHQIELKMGKRLSERLSVWAAMSSEKNHSDHQEKVEYYISGATYETSNRNYKLNLDFAQRENIIWNLSYSMRRGDVLVTTMADLDYNYDIARAIRPDPSFGPERDIYRLNGSTQTIATGITHSINTNWTLHMHLQKNWTIIPGGVNYQRHGFSMSASYQF
ncbi:hypothetical protein [Undibacterium fentianense]|uniref:Uncharacterized protein n=1 Tax=Undibacterium fentianense TaxID=2828728 RepID=A0A941DYC2_9BURK|nr:hypothetical protein [Undibacterium fentianense]MBR7799704.1 hypothetical protein [Undibacterium fentianense]